MNGQLVASALGIAYAMSLVCILYAHRRHRRTNEWGPWMFMGGAWMFQSITLMLALL